MKNEIRLVSIPSRPDVIKVIVVPAHVTWINADTAPDAKIIRLVQNLKERLEFHVIF